jgi:hypothetical protein
MIFSSACLGCGGPVDSTRRDAPIPTVPAREAKSPSHAAGPQDGGAPSKELKFDGIGFTLPAGWKQVAIPPEKQGFIDAQILVSAAGQELTLTLSSIGGGIEANVARWKTQFSSSATDQQLVDKIEVSGRRATWVDLSGTFRAAPGMAQGSQADWRMLGVGIPLEPRDFYLKLTGPAEAVEAAREEFREFVTNARFAP